ncbi:MAG TPA: PKD domain-containing protein [Chitinophagaceae bacterium]|nr:PKD domain-containing protein [Chitinophagaceae bacterium]
MACKKFISFIGLLLFSIPSLFAQCNLSIVNLPDTLLVCKNTAVPLNPSIGAGGGTPYYMDTTWTPATGLSNPNIINPVASIGTSSITYTLTIQAVTPVNLIPNGDFSQGNTLFSSSYVYGTGGPWGLLSNEGQYAIATNPNSTHINFASFGDHTTGTGNMMVVNGAGTPNVNIWCETINVNPNTWYDFSAWGATCVASNPAILQFSINGTLVGTPLALPLTTGLWTQFHVTWFSGSNTTITICITDQATALSGNDFAIDDISFREICTVSDSIHIETVNLTPSIQTENHFGCQEDTVFFFANNGAGTLPTSYQWSFGDGSGSSAKDTFHIYPTQGVYTVKLITERNGCKDSSSVTVNTLHPLQAAFAVSDTFCVGEVVTVVDNSVTSGPTTYQWNWGDGTIDQNTSHVYSTAGLFQITLVLQDTIGCIDSATRSIIVQEAPWVSFTLSDSLLCVGEPIFISDTVNDMTQQFTWDFQDGVVLNNVHHPMHTYYEPNVYTITLTGKNLKCPNSVFTRTVEIEDYPAVNLGPDTSICPGVTTAIILTNQLNPGAISTWSTGEISNQISVNTPGRYWIQTNSAKGACISTDSIWVQRDCYLNIPNSFSPNGDGRNDYFLPREILSSGISSFEMQIFNRWGELIFSTTQSDGRGWDGKYNGVDQPNGVYIYLIRAVFMNGVQKEYTGNVTLLR